MILTPQAHRATPENIVPMINVVFLLLIFFLMTAAIAPPDPVAVTPPVAGADGEVPRDGRLYLAADGTLAFGDLRGDAAVAAAVAASEPGGGVILMADSAVDGATFARLVARLGPGEVRLVTTPGPAP